MDPRLRTLGARIAQAQDEGPPEIDLERQRHRFLVGAGRERVAGFSGDAPPRRSMRTVALLAAAFGALAAVSVLAVLRLGTTRPLTFQVGGAHGQEGQWIAAAGDGELPIAFSDGSALVLAHESRARVAHVSRDGAKVLVERGAVDVAVVHRDDSRWEVDAGPFKVYVVGTRFDVSWDPVSERFGLALRDGRVRVEGPTLPMPLTVSTGQRLEIALSAPKPVSATPDVSAQLSAEQDTKPSKAEPPAPSARGEAARRVGQAALLEDGLARASASDLIAMADAARYSGRPAQAAETLLQLRTRLPSDPDAGRAAFLLGRIYFDQLRSYAEAARWFSTYLDEVPNGEFAQEAAGRLIESEERRGAPDRARQAASSYLARYPQGTYDGLARQVLRLRPQTAPGSPEP